MKPNHSKLIAISSISNYKFETQVKLCVCVSSHLNMFVKPTNDKCWLDLV